MPGTRSLRELRFAEYNRIDDLQQIEQIWCGLLETCEHEYFLSWGWMSTWLASLPPEVDVRLVVGLLEEQPALAFFLGANRRRKYGILPTRLLALNTTGIRHFDQLYLEYNSMLAIPSLEFDLEALLVQLDGKHWREFMFAGLSSGFAQQAGLLNVDNIGSSAVFVEEEAAAFFVDLQKVRAAKMDYLQLLSSNKRSQIRRSVKEYQKDGEIHIEAAQNAPEALEMLSSLADLHQQEWQKRGKPGAFANSYLYDFHKKLIQARFEAGEIQMLRVATSAAPIGYLYNFIYNRKVLFYQSGLNYLSGNLYRPGLVSHYYAIQYNAQLGMNIYDFMAGEAGYKSSLGTDSAPMYWIRLVRGGLRIVIEKKVLQLKVRLRSDTGLMNNLKRIRDRFTSAQRQDVA